MRTINSCIRNAIITLRTTQRLTLPASELADALKREFGSTYDASVYADGAKSRFPKRMACALRQRNSSCRAIEVWRGAWRRYCLPDRTAHPKQEQEIGETASRTFPTPLAQTDRRNSAHTEQSAQTASLASPS